MEFIFEDYVEISLHQIWRRLNSLVMVRLKIILL